MSNIEFDFPIVEKTYKVVGKRDLKLYIFEPTSQETKRPAILFFNGGSFKKEPKSPVQFQHQAEYFSSLGMVAICVDYRNGADMGFLPTQAISDVKSAVRYVRRNSEGLRVDPNKVVVCGSSAGGYITVSAITFNDLNDDNQYENHNKDHVPSYLIIFAAGMDGIDIMARRYPQLLYKAKEISPIHNIKKCLPTTLWLCGTGDDLYVQNKKFINLMKHEGNEITLKTYKGMEHGFFNYGRHHNEYFNQTKDEMETFLRDMHVV